MSRKKQDRLDPPPSGGGYYVHPGVIVLENTLPRPEGREPQPAVGLPDGRMVFPEEVAKHAVGPWEGWVVRRGWLVHPLQAQLMELAEAG